MFKTILVATDGSGPARAAVDIAADIAAKYDAELLLFHAVGRGPVPEGLRHFVEQEHLVDRPSRQAAETPLAMDPVPGPGQQAAYAAKVNEAVGRRILGDAAKAAQGHGAKHVRRILGEGDPVRELLDRAKREGVDLIVMGSRGFGAIKGLLLGSVSHKVTQLAECTCITVR